METVTDLTELRQRIGEWKRAGQLVGFVPTMGNLHAGHYSLVRQASERADRVVASVFVNPTQFGPNEDFARYPRTPDDDAAGLRKAGCDILWMPTVETMYPYGPDASVRIVVPGVTAVLEGEHRPGHFDGVASVVTRLFNQVQPDLAIFGAKDYQQLAVIRHLVSDLSFPIEILAAKTLREADGLAMSSRNQYLSANERPVAAEIHRCLQWIRSQVQEGTPMAQVESEAVRRLREAGFVPDYVAVRTAGLELPVPGHDGTLVALVAARLGSTRLIDNLEFAA